jgi:hypothetical protein
MNKIIEPLKANLVGKYDAVSKFLANCRWYRNLLTEYPRA